MFSFHCPIEDLPLEYYEILIRKCLLLALTLQTSRNKFRNDPLIL